MHEAMLYEKLPDSSVRCNICRWRCTIGPDKLGVCRMYNNQDGILYNMNYARISSVAADPIEKKPLFHFFPGTLAFSLGSWGCNFHCQNCQNWEISCPEIGEPWRCPQALQPKAAIKLEKQYHCTRITRTYNEPTIWFS